MWMPPTQPGAFGETRERAAQVSGVDRRADCGRKNQVHVPPESTCGESLLRLSHPLTLERLHDAGWKIYNTIGPGRLDRPETKASTFPFQGLRDPRFGAAEVQVIPGQAQEFARS